MTAKGSELAPFAALRAGSDQREGMTNAAKLHETAQLPIEAIDVDMELARSAASEWPTQFPHLLPTTCHLLFQSPVYCLPFTAY